MIRKIYSAGSLLLLLNLPLPLLAQNHDWVSVLCTYSIPNKNSSVSKTTITSYGGHAFRFTEISKEASPDNFEFSYHLYINSKSKSVLNSNKEKIEGVFTEDSLTIYFPSLGSDIFKVRFTGKSYSGSKIYVENASSVGHVKGDCRTEKIDKCKLFPDICRPSRNRGF